MLTSKVLYGVIFLVLIIIFFVWQIMANKAPEPKYKLIKKEAEVEIREYPSLIFATVQVEGERYHAINTGFRLLADYIFGNNQGEKKIAMTAPVIQQGTQITMTAPVSLQKKGDLWNVDFVMPANFTLETLPKPNNTNIILEERSAGKYVVIRFSGGNNQNNLDKHLAILQQYIQSHHLRQKGAPIYAFYNPPWILPFLRRNEIMIEID